MRFAASWNQAWTAPLVNHLWQCTLVTLIACLLALSLRRNQARTRFWIWLAASLKFMIPFSLFVAAGEALRSTLATPLHPSVIAGAVEQVTQPFPQTWYATGDYSNSGVPAVAAHHAHVFPILLAVAWLSGLLFKLFSWTRAWWQIRVTVRSSSQMDLPTEIPVLSSPRLLEPGVFGILRPVLLLPENISTRLSSAQLRTIILHEMCHVRRRDNLTAALHMVVESLFWFHPAVWWIKARLLEERERACDEEVLQSGSEAQLYAESILNVCKFYVESPTPCMSGVTGSDLKQRIVRIMNQQVTRQLNFSRKLLLAIVALLSIAAPILFGLAHVTRVRAQSTPADPQDIADTWQGTLHAGQDLRIVYKITKADGGGYKAVSYSIDQGGQPIPVSAITLQGSTVKILVPAVRGTYEGKLSSDGKTIAGNWTQGPNPLPLVLTRATPETEWTIPTPPPPLPPMDANASPGFEVATIKPSKPDEPGKAFLVRGNRFQTINTTLTELISFSYGLHGKQIIGAPAWVQIDKWDLDGKPDGTGAPNDKQWKGMVQKLITDRFKLTFHREKKELSVYVLSVSKTGPKLTKSEGDPNGLPGLFFRGRPGDLDVRNATMGDFTGMMQNSVLDRPVVDQTGITGRWDFTLNWTPDDSQFGGMAAKIPPPTDNTNPPPALFTAIQEQIGLKLDATKAPADVLVVDHIEKPAEN